MARVQQGLARRPLPALLAAAALVTLSLAGCDSTASADSDKTAAENVDRSLAQALDGADGMTTITSAVDDAGLAGVFDGPGSYTVLAPDDAAFAKLGDTGKALMKPEEKAVLVAILRDHIVPGHLEPEAIRAAIAQRKGAVEMSTLGDGTVRFSLDGDAIAVEGVGNEKGHLEGDPLVARNGVILPVDTVLKQPPEETPASSPG